MTVYSESFETGYGSWVNDPANLGSNWVRQSGSTSSSSTGPSSAYSGSYYIFCETSSGSAYTAGDTDIIEYDMGALQDGNISFFYSQYGADQGTLYLEGYNGATWDVLWSSSGNQTFSTWWSRSIDFTGKSKLRFRNVAAGGYTGDVALDLIVTTHEDPDVKVNTEFQITTSGASIQSSISSSYGFTASTEEPYRGLRILPPEVVFDFSPAVLFQINTGSVDVLFETTASQTILIFSRLKQGINQLIANGSLQHLLTSNIKTTAMMISTVLSDSISKMQVLKATLLVGDPTLKTQSVLTSILNDYQKIQGLVSFISSDSISKMQVLKATLSSNGEVKTQSLSSNITENKHQNLASSLVDNRTTVQGLASLITGESAQVIQAINVLISGGGETKAQALSILINAIDSAQKLQGVLSVIGDKTEPIIDVNGSGDGTETPTITPPTNYQQGFIVTNNQQVVSVLPDGSCSGSCTAGYFNMETGSFDVPIEWISPPDGDIRTMTSQGVSYRTTKYKIFIDGKDVTNKIDNCSISISQSAPHDEISMSVSPIDYQFFSDCDETILKGQPRIEVQFYDGYGNVVRSKQFILNSRSVSGEHSFSIGGLSLSAMDDYYRDDIAFSLEDFTSAREVVESLLENCVLDWGIDDWLLPPGFQFSGKPFECVLTIAKIAMAVVRCDDDNTIIVRKKYKYRPIELPDKEADILYDRSSILRPGKTQNKTPGEGYTAVSVIGYGSNISPPTIELEESSPTVGQTVHLRIYWTGNRPIIEHTGEEYPLTRDLLNHYLTEGKIYFMGNEFDTCGFTESEDGSIEYTYYEFKNGVTSVEKPISSIEKFEWVGSYEKYERNPREGLNYFFDKNSKEIRADKDWGIAKIIYRTEYQRYAIFNHNIEILMAVLMLSSDSDISVNVIMKRLETDTSAEGGDPLWGEGVTDDNITNVNLAIEVGTVYLDDTRYDRIERTFTAPYFANCIDGNIAFIHDAEMGCTGNHYINSANIVLEGPKVTQSVGVFQCKL